MENENSNEKNNENSFIIKGVDKNSLSEESKQIIKKIPSIDFTYICKKCKNIPKLDIEYNKSNIDNLKSYEFIGKIYFRECNYSIELNEDNIDKIDLNLEKVPINKLKEENFMNINQFPNFINNNDNFLNFDSFDDFNKYIEVYKHYLFTKAIIGSYNLHDTKNDKIFTLFENLLFIGFYGYGTKYEYENSIAIKNFSFDKFYKYIKEYSSRLSKLVNINTINIKDLDIFHINGGDDNLYALFSYYKDNINSKGCYVLKYEDFLDKSFDAKKCMDYCREINNIPNENKKNVLFREKDEYLEDIISLGENKYLVRKEKRAFFNVRFDDSRVYTYIFDEKKNEYIIEEQKFDNNIEIEKISIFKKQKILVETINNLYIYEYNIENNNIKFNLIKKFAIKSNENFREMRGKINLFEAKNGDIIYYYPSSLIVISPVTYQIKTIVKLNAQICLEQLNKDLISVDDLWKFDFTSLCFDINKIKLIRINSLDKRATYYLNKNNNICLTKKGHNYYIMDLKSKKIMLSREIDNTIIKNEQVFIFNKKEKIFGISLNYSNEEKELMIFQLKL